MKATEVPSDAVVYTFSFLEAGLRLKTNKAEICRFFYKMSQENEFKNLLEDLVFSTHSYDYPHSDSVFNAIDRLTMSSLVSMIDLEAYEITEALTKKDAEEIFNKKECELLSKLAERFSTEVKTYLPSWHKKYKS